MEALERGKRLAEARKRKHLSQEEAAARLAVQVTTIYRWEAGKTLPQPTHIRSICEVYAVEPEDVGLVNVEVSAPKPERTTHISTYAAGDLTMQLLALPTLARGPIEIQDRLAIILEEYDTMSDTHKDIDALISRRQALHRLAGIPILTFGLTSARPVLKWPKPEIINQCAASVAACWELSRSSDGLDLTKAGQGVSAYLPTLEAIVKDSSGQYHKDAASLAGQCYLLKMLLGWHTEGHDRAAFYAEQAIIYSKEAGDVTLWLAVQDYASWCHYYDRRFTKMALQTAEQTIPLLKDKGIMPPRLASGLYSTLAVMQARNGKNATATLKKASDTFFGSGGDEEHRFLYMDYGVSELILNDGMVMYYQQDYGKALDSFGQIIDPETLAMKRPLPERSKIEMLNLMSLASLKSPEKDLEKALHLWTPAIQGAHALQSEQRFSEAATTYDIMEAVFPHEQRIKDLRELTVHW